MSLYDRAVDWFFGIMERFVERVRPPRCQSCYRNPVDPTSQLGVCAECQPVAGKRG